MKKVALWPVMAVMVLTGGLFAYRLAFASADSRPDCPGKIVCPITGQEICKDECPLVDLALQGCPGKITCSLTGDIVCADGCPVALGGSAKKAVHAEESLVTLKIAGMTCSKCVASVEGALKKVEGVKSAEVSMKGKNDGQAIIAYDAKKVSVDQLIAAIEKAGGSRHSFKATKVS